MSKLGPNRAYPSIPTIRGDLNSHTAALKAMAEALQIHERRTKDILDSFVRVRELQDLGLIRVDGDRLVDNPIGVESHTHDGWDDLRFPASSFNPPGSASDPDFDGVNGVYLFAPSGTELIFLTAQMPHGWNEGSVLHPHCHWYKTTSASGNVVWELQYKWCPINEVMDGSFTTLTGFTTVGGTPDTDTAEKHLITSLGEIDGAGKTFSDMLVMKFARLGSDGSDTYGADAALLEFDIHYEIVAPGTREQFSND